MQQVKPQLFEDVTSAGPDFQMILSNHTVKKDFDNRGFRVLENRDQVTIF
jgi:hypothetical protein